MFSRGLLFAGAAALAALAASPAANAGPAHINFALQGNDAAITKVDYYYRGYGDRYGYGPNLVEGLFGLPFAVLGTAAGLVGGALTAPFGDGAYYDGPYYDSSYYGSPYYGSPYYSGGYDDGRYYGGAYVSGSSAYDGYGSRYDGRTYDDGRYDRASYDRPAYYGGAYYAGSNYGAHGGAYGESGVAACEREFRSFDPASGTYVTYGGEVLPCPYLDR
ncbi:MAG: BA14K family protein [Rhodomicrobium sp.]